MSDRLDPESANEVLRRAAELATARGIDPTGYDRELLAEAAVEVGIDRGAVARALAEHDVGALVRDHGRQGLLGSPRVVVTRTVPLPRAAAHDQVQRWLRRQMLELSERTERDERWRPRQDLAAKVRRTVDAKVTKRVRIGNVDAVRLSTAAAGADATVVCLEAEFDHMRRGLATGVVAVPAVVAPLLGASAGIVTGEVLFLLGSVPLGVAFGGLGVVGARRTLTHERDDVGRVLRLFLDDLG